MIYNFPGNHWKYVGATSLWTLIIHVNFACFAFIRCWLPWSVITKTFSKFSPLKLQKSNKNFRYFASYFSWRISFSWNIYYEYLMDTVQSFEISVYQPTKSQILRDDTHYDFYHLLNLHKKQNSLYICTFRFFSTFKEWQN